MEATRPVAKPRRSIVLAAAALVGVTIYCVASAFPHTEAGHGIGRRIVFLSGWFALWRFLYFVALIAVTITAALRIARRPHRRFEAGMLLGAGGVLLIDFLRYVLPGWTSGDLGFQPTIGGYALLFGLLLMIGAGVLSLQPDADSGRPSIRRRAALLAGAIAVAAAHLLPVRSQTLFSPDASTGKVESQGDVDLRVLARFRLLDENVIGLAILALVALVAWLVASERANLASRGALFAIGILSLAFVIQILRGTLVSPFFHTAIGTYLLLAGSAALVLSARRSRPFINQQPGRTGTPADPPRP